MRSRDGQPQVPSGGSLKRPLFLDLTRISFPVGAVCSFAHRLSGVALAAATPLAAAVFARSLAGAEGYAEAVAWLAPFPARVALVLAVWALSHHLLAGIRHLLMDAGIGSRLGAARASAWIVNFAGVAIAALALGSLQ